MFLIKSGLFYDRIMCASIEVNIDEFTVNLDMSAGFDNFSIESFGLHVLASLEFLGYPPVA